TRPYTPAEGTAAGAVTCQFQTNLLSTAVRRAGQSARGGSLRRREPRRQIGRLRRLSRFRHERAQGADPRFSEAARSEMRAVADWRRGGRRARLGGGQLEPGYALFGDLARAPRAERFQIYISSGRIFQPHRAGAGDGYWKRTQAGARAPASALQ